jgi:putative ABC transport system substrate-binding protein
MRRRDFITLVGGTAATSPALAPLASRAQVAGKVWRIGYIGTNSRDSTSPSYNGFLQGMRDLGYVEGKDFVREWRSAEGDCRSSTSSPRK